MKMHLILFAGLGLLASASAPAGEIVSQAHPIESIRHIEAGSAIRLDIRQGENETLSAEATAEVHERLRISVRGDRLILGVRKARGGLFGWFGSSNDDVRFVIELPHLDGLELSGASRARLGAFDAQDLTVRLSGASRVLASSLTFNELELRLSGASRIEFNQLQGESLSAWVSGASHFDIGGESSVQNLQLDVSGASHYQGASLLAEQATANASGASRIEMGNTESLDANASGASTIGYRGQPQLRQQTSGASTIHSRGD